MKLADLRVSTFNARQSHTEDSVKELEGSIDKYGMISKIILRKNDDYYEVIAGGRRYLALKQLHGDDYDLPESDYIIMNDLTDEQALILSIQENQQRTALSPFDMAKAIYSLKSEFKVKEEDILKIFGINSYRYKRLLHVIDDWDAITEPAVKEELKKPEGGSPFTDAHWEKIRKLDKPEVVKDVFSWIMDKQCPPSDLPLVIKGIEHNYKKQEESPESTSTEKPKAYVDDGKSAPILDGPIEYEHKGELKFEGKGKKKKLLVATDRETIEVPVEHYMEFLNYPEQFKCYVTFKLTVKPIVP
jgi:ParB/RepB/Spo0J family partition protein